MSFYRFRSSTRDPLPLQSPVGSPVASPQSSPSLNDDLRPQPSPSASTPAGSRLNTMIFEQILPYDRSTRMQRAGTPRRVYSSSYQRSFRKTHRYVVCHPPSSEIPGTCTNLLQRREKPPNDPPERTSPSTSASVLRQSSSRSSTLVTNPTTSSSSSSSLQFILLPFGIA